MCQRHQSNVLVITPGNSDPTSPPVTISNTTTNEHHRNRQSLQIYPLFDISSFFSPRLSPSRPPSSSSFSTRRSAPSSNSFSSPDSAASHSQLPQATRVVSTVRNLELATMAPHSPRQVIIVRRSLPSPPPSSIPASPSLKPHRSPTIEPTSLPLPPPIFPHLIPCPTLDLLTPTYLRHLRGSNPERPLYVRGITPAAFDQWESRFPDHELREADDMRYEYDSVMQRLIVKCMPGPIHDSLQIYFVRRIMEEGFRTTSIRSMTVASGTSIIRPPAFVADLDADLHT